jgi:hypothetical protein
MRVILRPTSRHTWSNVVKYKNCYDYLTPYFTRSGNTYTGLIKDDEIRLGAILGVNLVSSSPYWKDFFVRIGSDDVFLDTEDPLDELKYLFLKNHKRVKSSVFERKATADYLLINKDEEAKRENLINKSKVESISEFRKMSVTDMRKALRLFGQNADNASGEMVENSLFKIIESNPDMFLTKWIRNPYREMEVVLETAISKNIIRRNKNVYKYGSETIGYSAQEAIDFLNNPKNQDIKISVLSAIEAKDYIQEHEAPIEAIEELRESGVDIPEDKIIKKPKVSKSVLAKGRPGMDEEGIDITKLAFGPENN